MTFSSANPMDYSETKRMKRPLLHIQKSLAFKLSLGILLIVAPVFIVCISFLFVRSRQIVKEEAKQHATHSLENTALHIEKYMEEVEVATENISWLVMKNPNPDSLLNYSRRVVELNPNISGCSITMEPGFFPQLSHNFSAYTIREEQLIETEVEKDYNYYEKVWYKKPTELGKACWTDPYNDFNEGTLSSPFIITSYCKPLFTEQGDQIGVIATDLSAAWLNNILASQKPYPNSFCLMLGSNGAYIVHPNRLKQSKQSIFTAYDEDKHPDISALGKAMTTGEKGSQHVEFDGSKYWVFYQPVKGTQWSIALVCPESDILGSYQTLTLVLIPLILIGLLLMLFFCWKTTKHFIRPIDQLALQTEQLAQSDFSTKMPRSNRNDVVGNLQNSFSTMQESIDQNIKDIMQTNEEAERNNQELDKANQLAQEATQRKDDTIREASRLIRTPLNIIGGFIQVLRDNQTTMSEKDAEEAVEAINQNSIIIRRMAHMLFDVSRKEYLPLDCKQEIEVNSLMEEVMENVKEMYPKGSDINYTNLLPNPLTIHSNRLYLVRSVRELLINAKKFASENPINFRTEVVGGMVRFTIEDHGPGIPAELHKHVFDPFFKMDIYSEGFGIGLGLTKQHVRDLGGTMILDADYKDGVRFLVEIPNA